MAGACPIVLFADRLPPLVGGVEMHAVAFIEHFTSHPRFPLAAVVTRSPGGADALLARGALIPCDLAGLRASVDPGIVFFNSGRWIEEMRELRRRFPSATFVYRTGGNEILKAPLERAALPVHAERQAFWLRALNDTVDLVITNSHYTEARLRDVGVTREFLRAVGGVNLAALAPLVRPPRAAPLLFCAARFVPYKNHRLLIDVVAALRRRGHAVHLRLAGDGPLLSAARERVLDLGLGGVVEFLGARDNADVCHEIVSADGYVQLSSDFVTDVEGGSYVHTEGMGRSILEALSAGTFVIAGRSGALPEIVLPERGVLIEIGDAESIADALAPLIVLGLPRPSPLDIYGWGRVFLSYERSWKGIHARAHRD